MNTQASRLVSAEIAWQRFFFDVQDLRMFFDNDLRFLKQFA